MVVNKELANRIAKSQTDLGGKSQVRLAENISGYGDYDLDELSTLIVYAVRYAADVEELKSSIGYYINQLTSLKTTLENEH